MENEFHMVMVLMKDEFHIDVDGIISVGEAYRNCPKWLSLLEKLTAVATHTRLKKVCFHMMIMMMVMLLIMKKDEFYDSIFAR